MQDFSTALQAWRDVHLDDFGQNLVEAAESIAHAQERSVIARQTLAERTRDFKRQSADLQLQGIRALLKQYQAEIDALMARAKKSEAVVLQTKNRFKAVPDPYPILEALVDATIQEHDISQLRAEIVQLQSDCLEWEQRYKSAEERCRVSSESSAKTTNMVEEAITSTTQRFQRQQERLERDLKAAYAHIRELRESHEFITSRFDSHGETAVDPSQIDVLMLDLERAKERASKAELDTEQVREMMRQQHAAQIQEMSGRVATLESQLDDSRRERSREAEAQAEELEALRRAMKELQDTHTSATQAWEKERSTLLHTFQNQSEYAYNKQELNARQKRDGDEEMEPSELAGVPDARADPLTKDANPESHAATDELLKEQARLAESLESEKAQVHRLKALNTKLESELSKQVPSAAGSVGLLPMVTSQRDRFRSRVAELEQQVKSQSRILQEQLDQLSHAPQKHGLHASSAVDMPYPGGETVYVSDREHEYAQPWQSLRVRVRLCG